MPCIQAHCCAVWPPAAPRTAARAGGRLRRVARVGGFTLIEILVVVAIIALLIAVLVPSLAAARAVARTSVCASNEKQMGLAMAAFAAEHKGRIPRGISRHGKPDPSGPVNWVRMVARMFGDRNNYAENFNRVPVERHAVFSCPQRSQEYGGVFLDYVVNSIDRRGPMNLSPCVSAPTSGLWYEVEGVTRIDDWPLAAETVYITEAVEESWNVSDLNNSWGTLRGIRENIATVRRAVPPTQTGYDFFDVAGGKSLPTHRSMLGPTRLPRAALAMHRKATNALFVDGHVGSVVPPKADAGPVEVYRFYMRLFGVDRRTIPLITAYETTAALHPCAAGDTDWRP